MTAGMGHPVGLKLTAARESDIKQAGDLLADHAPAAVIADRGYDSKARADGVGARAVIPTRKSRTEQREVDPHPYAERNGGERFWSKAEQYRRVATRYDKKDANYLGFVRVASLVGCRGSPDITNYLPRVHTT